MYNIVSQIPHDSEEVDVSSESGEESGNEEDSTDDESVADSEMNTILDKLRRIWGDYLDGEITPEMAVEKLFIEDGEYNRKGEIYPR